MRVLPDCGRKFVTRLLEERLHLSRRRNPAVNVVADRPGPLEHERQIGR